MLAISELIRTRRAYFPKTYTEKPISENILQEILENANWAPTHKRTEPWRFKVFHSAESRQRMTDFIAADFKLQTPEDMFSEIKLKEVAEKPILSACTIAICMQRDAAQSLPEWEEIAAVACAVQNMWLTATAFDIGSYWSTPGFISRLGPILHLNEGECCLGLFYMGYLKEGFTAPANRKPIQDKILYL